ncbi:glucose-6-phosphate isomerase [Pelagibacteraceae bacterium]|nr:glucose-6-phosphate isomerase [Pelagibacteraceae bacterium]
MKKKNLLIKNIIQKKYLNSKLKKKFSIKFKKIINKIETSIDSPSQIYSILNKDFKFDFDIQNLKKFKKFKTVALIGMGGSILGSEAIYNFLNIKIKKKFYFFDNIDEKKLSIFKKEFNLNKVLFLVISKSGNTVETLSNFLFLNIIKKNQKNIILISEKKNNVLFNLSKKYNLFYIEHKNFIGGRYSVLSEVGIVPAYIMGLNIIKLRKNIRIHLIKKEEKVILKDSTIKLANILFQKKISNLIFLNYSPELVKLLEWTQQLIAESLGKKGKGFLPFISSAPKDHHSLLQLYLDGPRDKLFNIFSIEEKSEKNINSKKFTNQINYLNNKSLNKIKIAQKNALIKSLINNKIPYREFKIKQIDEETIGELFSYFMLETIIIGKLIDLNPFNQPAVEQVKKDTIKILN